MMTGRVGAFDGLVALLLAGATATAGPREAEWRAESGYAGQYVVIQEDDAPRPPFALAEEDDAFLDEVQRATFRWMWDSPDNTRDGLIKDRTSGPLISIAGVGYQLGAMVIGAERGWVTRDEASARALRILQALMRNETSRKRGLFYHFLDETTLGPRPTGDGVSTIDSAILFAGVLTAASYFGGEVAEVGNAMFAAADWSFFQHRGGVPEWDVGMISMLWKPDDRVNAPVGEGSLISATWHDAMGEQRLIYVLAAAAPEAAHRVDAEVYYRMRRPVGTWGDLGPMVRLPHAGGTFLTFFDQLWIDDASIGATMGPDRPDQRGIAHRAAVDWWENSRRHGLMHRGKAIREAPSGFSTLGEHAWGLSASDAPGGYRVPGLYPAPLPMDGAAQGFDVPESFANDEWLDGTVAIYGAGCMVMFMPAEAIAALRHYRTMAGPDGTPLLWDDEHGFVDAFNLHVKGGPWIAEDRLAIDQGPLLIAIENARSGLIWDTFHAHPFIRDAMGRLGLDRGK